MYNLRKFFNLILDNDEVIAFLNEHEAHWNI